LQVSASGAHIEDALAVQAILFYKRAYLFVNMEFIRGRGGKGDVALRVWSRGFVRRRSRICLGIIVSRLLEFFRAQRPVAIVAK